MHDYCFVQELLRNEVAHYNIFKASPYPWLFLQSGHHDNGAGSLLPHHPPEITQCLWQRPLSSNVGILLPVAVDVIGINVVTSWNGCKKDKQCA